MTFNIVCLLLFVMFLGLNINYTYYNVFNFILLKMYHAFLLLIFTFFRHYFLLFSILL